MLGNAKIHPVFPWVETGDLECVDVINDLRVLVDNRMIFVDHIESIVSKSARMLGFIKRISREFNDL
jgi:hypothetical protein